MNNQKGFANIILIIIGVIVVGAIVWYFLSKGQVASPTNKSQSSVDIADWESYRNNDFGYELRFPRRYEVSTYEGDALLHNAIIGDSSREGNINIAIVRESENYVGDANLSGCGELKTTQVTISGVTADRLDCDFTEKSLFSEIELLGKSSRIKFPHNNMRFTINILMTNKELASDSEIIDKIISSIRLIK